MHDFASPLQGAVVFDAQATYGTTGVSVLVDGDGPTITIYTPMNKTYEQNSTLYLFAHLQDPSGIGSSNFSIDSFPNLTLSVLPNGTAVSSLFFPFGSHTLYVHSQDLLGNKRSANVSFTFNTSIATTMNWTKFEYPGSTNLSQMNASQMANVSNFTLFVPQYGKLIFNVPLNLTDDADTDAPVDLNSHIILTPNFIFINTTALPNLNKSTNITFYNLSFTNPVILHNGVTCPDTLCETISYIDGELTFRVSHFSSYEAGEAESQSGSSSSGQTGVPVGGGGNAGVIRTMLGILSEKKTVKLFVGSRVFFTLLNNDGKPQDHALTITKLDRAQNLVSFRIDSQHTIQDSLALLEIENYGLDVDTTKDITLSFDSLTQNAITFSLSPYQQKNPSHADTLQQSLNPSDDLPAVPFLKEELPPSAAARVPDRIYVIVLFALLLILLCVLLYLGRRMRFSFRLLKHKK